MKKIIFSLAMAFISMNAICQTTAIEIIERYNKVSGFDKVSKDNTSMLMEVEINTPLGQIPMKLIKGSATQFRIEMTMMKQDILVVINGTQGWVKALGQDAKPIPQDEMDAFASQGDVTNSLQIDDKLFDFTVLEDKGGVQTIKGTPKDGATKHGIIETTLSFDKKSGMIIESTTKTDKDGEKIDATIKMSGVKEFSGIKIPTKMSVKTLGGGNNANIQVNKIKIGYPVTASMFAKPE